MVSHAAPEPDSLEAEWTPTTLLRAVWDIMKDYRALGVTRRKSGIQVVFFLFDPIGQRKALWKDQSNLVYAWFQDWCCSLRFVLLDHWTPFGKPGLQGID